MEFESESEKAAGQCLATITNCMIYEGALSEHSILIGWFGESDMFILAGINQSLGQEELTLMLASAWRCAVKIEGKPAPVGLWWAWSIPDPDVISPEFVKAVKKAPGAFMDGTGAFVAVAYVMEEAQAYQIVYPISPNFDHWWGVITDDQTQFTEKLKLHLALASDA